MRFGAFEVSFKNRELRKFGLRVRLQQKPLQVLNRLLETPREFVTREEFAEVLWPDLHVSVDRSLNTAMNALRRALGDEGRNPRFIETRPGLGYRFIADVETFEGRGEAPQPSALHANTEADQDYLKGRYFSDRMTEEDLHKSVAYFESALARDPEHALACTGLADTYTQFAFHGIPTGESFVCANKFAARALRIDDRLPEAHLSMAGVKRTSQWDWTGAEADYRKALELNALDPRAHCLYADHLAAMGRFEEARREITLARDLDPVSLVIGVEQAWILYVSRDFQAAAEQSWKTLALEPRFAPAQNTLGLAYQSLGLMEEALVELENARLCSGEQPTAVAALAHALASAGRRGEAARCFEQLERAACARRISPYWIALVHTAFGATGRAFECLNRAFDYHDPWLVWLKTEPRFDPLREDPRFSSLTRRIRAEFA